MEKTSRFEGMIKDPELDILKNHKIDRIEFCHVSCLCGPMPEIYTITDRDENFEYIMNRFIYIYPISDFCTSYTYVSFFEGNNCIVRFHTSNYFPEMELLKNIRYYYREN